MLRPPNSPQVPATVPTPPPVISASPIVPTPITPDLPPVLPPRPLTPQPPQIQSNSEIPPVVTPSPPPALPQIPTQIVSLYGHLPYQEDEPQRLVQVGSYYNRIEYLDIEAAEAFNRMKLDAKTNGISLKLISGFRSIADQEQLFTKQIQRRGSKEAASKLSAPPGYSEHHTGYAIDIGDEQQPNTDLKFEFEDTETYRWLTAYAGNYGFELSFPRNNFQKVSFEPWHWRYVASPRSQQIFATARSFLH
ncbi:D-alanyl-D-alanine carboxypeptidase family protein [Chroococcus sp. FPU101]|uniref:M15 family metallopeptidase n=1 Tax=Chroococcus sp. FPU101 TaxID=1974212 RepID=UPI001F5D764D|nr:M15 family metallopeptidase [Chroococcus sp. FPU101]